MFGCLHIWQRASSCQFSVSFDRTKKYRMKKAIASLFNYFAKLNRKN